MTFRHLKVLGWTLVFLLVIELGLELRAHLRGWETLVFGGAEVAGEQASVFGPTPDFPFRSLIVDPQKPESTTRYWIASASHAEDAYIAPELTFPHRFHEIMADLGHPIQVLNASKNGANIGQNAKDLGRLWERWQPDVVVVYQMYLDINAIARRFLADGGSAEQLRPEEAAEEERGGGEVNWTVRLTEQTTAYRHLQSQVRARLTRARIRYDRIGHAAELEFERRLLELTELIEMTGARPLLCTFATSHDHAGLDQLPEEVVNWLAEGNMYLSEEGWFDTIERFNDVIRRVAHERGYMLADVGAQLTGQTQYFRDFVHFSVEGHQRVAEVLAEAVLASDTSTTIELHGERVRDR